MMDWLMQALQRIHRWFGIVLLCVMVLMQLQSLGARLLLNLDSVCIIERVSANSTSDACMARLPYYLHDTQLTMGAVRLASLVSLTPRQDVVAHQILQMELAPRQLDVVSGSRVLLLRWLYDRQSDDLNTWRGVASSQVLANTARWLDAIGASREAIEAYELAYLLDNGWRDAWQRGLNARSVGKRYIESGQLEQARVAYEKAAASFAETTEPLAREYGCYAYSRLGMMAEQNGHLAEAIDYYSRAILVSPQHAAFSPLVDLLLRQKHGLGEVYAFFADLRQKGRQDDSYLWSNSALVFIERGAPQMAERVLSEVPLELRDALSIRLVRARLAMAQGRWSQAEMLYTALLAEEKSAENGDVVRQALLSNALGEALLKQDRPVEASGLFAEAARLAPTVPVYWYNLGLAYQQLGRREARAAFEKALALKPDYAAAQKALRDLKP